jgi:hypothetical protein
MISNLSLHNINKYLPVLLPDGRKVVITLVENDFRINPVIILGSNNAPYKN